MNMSLESLDGTNLFVDRRPAPTGRGRRWPVRFVAGLLRHAPALGR